MQTGARKLLSLCSLVYFQKDLYNYTVITPKIITFTQVLRPFLCSFKHCARVLVQLGTCGFVDLLSVEPLRLCQGGLGVSLYFQVSPEMFN